MKQITLASLCILSICLLCSGALAYSTKYYANSIVYTFSYPDDSIIRQSLNITGLALRYISTNSAVYADTALHITRITQEPTNMYVFPRKTYQYFSFDTNTTAPLIGFAKVFVEDSFFDGLVYTNVDVFYYDSGWKQTHSAVAKVSGGYEYTFTLAQHNYYVIGSIDSTPVAVSEIGNQQLNEQVPLAQNQTIVYPLTQAPIVSQSNLIILTICVCIVSVGLGSYLLMSKKKSATSSTGAQQTPAQKDAKKLIEFATKKDPKLAELLTSIQEKYSSKKIPEAPAQKTQPQLALEVAQLEQETVHKFLTVAKTQQLTIEQVQEQLTQLQIHPQLLEHALVEYESQIQPK
jgi:hypothetical protein